MGSKPIDETGNRYGRLVALEEAGRDKHRNCLWRCSCDCGNEVIVNGSSLRRGHTKSCGCFQRELASTLTFSRVSRLPLGQAAFNSLYSSYSYGAKKRGISFKLTKEEFSHTTKMNCFYCGEEPGQVKSGKRVNGSYIYNGIDRIDSSKGYTLDNVVPCCGICNKMKGTMSASDFLKYIEKIYKYNRGEQGGINANANVGR